jgi:hypothetical protein
VKNDQLDMIGLPSKAIAQQTNEFLRNVNVVVVAEESAPVLKEEVQLTGAHLFQTKFSPLSSAMCLHTGVASASEMREADLIPKTIIGEREAFAS